MDRRDIKRNKVMRAWYRYRRIIGALAAVLVLVVVLVVFVGKLGKNPDKNTVVSNTTAATEPTSAAEMPTQPIEIPTEEIVTEPTTEVPTSGAREIVVEEFTNQDFYEDAVVLGDTFVSGISLYSFLDAKKIVADTNWTVGKAQTSGVSKVAAAKPGKVVIELGINDLNYEGRTTQRIVDDYTSLIAAIKKELPDVSIYVVSIFPITSGFEGKSTIYIKNSQVKEVNEALAKLEGVRYIDLFGAMSDEKGYLNTDLSTNGLNIKKSYYPYILNSIAQLGQEE